MRQLRYPSRSSVSFGFGSPSYTLRMRVVTSTGTQEIGLCAERPQQGSSNLDAVLAALRGRGTNLAPGTVIGAGVFIQTGRVWPALVVACLVGRPTVAVQNVVAGWIERLEPRRRRRPRRRGS
jgi:hypothetical protein